MNVVMPLAGRGARFKEIGIDVPKPLISVAGRPMYAWAMESLPLALARRVIFICQAEHLEGWGLREDIESRYGWLSPVIVPLATVTEGQACTVLQARDIINNVDPLLIYNGDTFCRTDLEVTLPRLPGTVSGFLGVFQAEGDRWSFAKVDEMGKVVETAEKRRISPWATTGLYYFRKGSEFVQYAESMIERQDRVNGEFYIAPVYNYLIADGRDIRVDVAKEVGVMGTPEDLERFLERLPSGDERLS